MDTAEIVIGEDGRIIRPVGVTLRVPAEMVVPQREESDEERGARLERFFKETEEALEDALVREVCNRGVTRLSRSTGARLLQRGTARRIEAWTPSGPRTPRVPR